jgi:hypothetical protein
MISLKNKTMTLGGVTHRYNFETWYATPRGLTDKLEEAVTACESLDLDPDMTISPRTVAVARDGVGNLVLHEVIGM